MLCACVCALLYIVYPIYCVYLYVCILYLVLLYIVYAVYRPTIYSGTICRYVYVLHILYIVPLYIVYFYMYNTIYRSTIYSIYACFALLYIVHTTSRTRISRTTIYSVTRSSTYFAPKTTKNAKKPPKTTTSCVKPYSYTIYRAYNILHTPPFYYILYMFYYIIYYFILYIVYLRTCSPPRLRRTCVHTIYCTCAHLHPLHIVLLYIVPLMCLHYYMLYACFCVYLRCVRLFLLRTYNCSTNALQTLTAQISHY